MAREAMARRGGHRCPASASSEKLLSGLARQVPNRPSLGGGGSLKLRVLGLAWEARRPQEGTGAASVETRTRAHLMAKGGAGKRDTGREGGEGAAVLGRGAGGPASGGRSPRGRTFCLRGPQGLPGVTTILGRPGKQRGLLIPRQKRHTRC